MKKFIIEHESLDDLNKALLLASFYHNKQIDKGGNNYILHPLSVMSNIDKLNIKKEVNKENCYICAILHDIIEDTDITLQDLKDLHFHNDIIENVDLLTHKKNISYESYIVSISSSYIATIVKLGDLINNMDLKRLSKITDKDIKRKRKYEKYFNYLNLFL